MKLKPREIDAFIRKPDPAVQAILVFGPDQGLVQERCRQLAKTVLEDLTEPFRLTDTSDADVRQALLTFLDVALLSPSPSPPHAGSSSDCGPSTLPIAAASRCQRRVSTSTCRRPPSVSS